MYYSIIYSILALFKVISSAMSKSEHVWSLFCCILMKLVEMATLTLALTLHFFTEIDTYSFYYVH